MAQYQKNFYSSTLYGRIKAFYGEYLTEAFDAQEPFSSAIDAKFEAVIPSTFYGATSPEFIPADPTKWTQTGTALKTATLNTPIDFVATGDNIEVHLQLQDSGTQEIEARLYQEQLIDGNYQWVQKEIKTFNTLSLTKAGTAGIVKFGSYGYADHKVSIQVLSTAGSATVLGVKLQTSHFSAEISASTDNATWSEWEKTPLTKQVIDGDVYLVTGKTPTSYTAVRYVKAKLILMSSDNGTSPVIERVELRSDDSGLYDTNGDYTVQVDMSKVAEGKAVSFKRATNIRWKQTTPPAAGTEITVRSTSSPDNIFWGPVTAPYRANTGRLRLKRNVVSHSVTIGPINEKNNFVFTDISSMLTWNTEAFAPKDPSNTLISYIFSKTKTDQRNPENKLQEITNPMNVSNRALTFSPQPYFLTVELSRTAGRATPVVDMVSMDQQMNYKEEVHVVDKDVAAVDADGTGIKKLQAIQDYPFTYPSITGKIPFNQEQIQNAQQRFLLEDKTARPTDIILYMKSQEKESSRTNITFSATDEVMVRAIQRKMDNGEKTGLMMHFLYGAGEVQYLRPYDREVSSGFTPSLETAKRYRYYLKNGWPNATHKVISGQDLSEIADMYKLSASKIHSANPDILANEDNTLINGQLLVIPNTYTNARVSLLFSNGTSYTMKSSHNALYDKAQGQTVTDLSGDTFTVSVPNPPAKGYVDWTSEEKIYTGVINADDVRDGYTGTQFNRSANSGFYRQYVVKADDTWTSIAASYEVAETVLKALNNSLELKVGVKVLVPPNIILPELAPEAEFEKDNPYQIEIVADSVKKKDGTRVDESFIPVDWNAKRSPMTITYRNSDILTAEMVRGDMLNGMDPLPLSGVVEILSVKRADGAITYHPWNETLQSGDYRLNSNYVDWAPAASGMIEPAAGETYQVTYRRREVDHVEIYLDTTYFEKMGADIVWRSPEVKVFEGICSPGADFRMAVPSPSTFENYSPVVKNIGYVIEDNDLWVETKLENVDGQDYLIGTLNGKDPSKNWHPTIRTGYYYLKEQEHYLYSEPLKTVLGEKEIPTVKDVEYVNGPTGIGALLKPGGTNYALDSVFSKKTWTKTKVFPKVPLTAAGTWVVEVSRL